MNKKIVYSEKNPDKLEAVEWGTGKRGKKAICQYDYDILSDLSVAL